jgi:hypothetical protein
MAQIPTGITNPIYLIESLTGSLNVTFIGRIRASGRVLGIMVHKNLPEAPFLPDLSVVRRSTERTRITERRSIRLRRSEGTAR